MPHILLLTTAPLPHADTEIEELASVLESLGARATVIPWFDVPALEEPYDLVVIRSTWDYFQRVAEFHTVLAGLTAPLANSLETVKWNSHKGYLVQLAAAGIPVIPTAVVTAGTSPESLPSLDGAAHDHGIIIKPAVSAGAIGVGRYQSRDAAALAHLRELTAHQDALVQPFVPEVADGEISIQFIEGQYSHAVLKVPAADDFRVQEEHGGRTTPYQPSDAELAVATAAIGQVTEGLLYARVDLVRTADGPKVMELELIEPALFLPTAPGSTEKLAKAILARV
ncbi:hypothetical protein D1871_08550 [Nakamurella silvestris]|nr:hypothetical protein D1871_08550 [Nakamurella silvestris]